MERSTRIKHWTRSRHWTSLRKAVQYLVLVVILYLLIRTRSGTLPPNLSNLLFRLDPLAILAQALASRTFLAGSSLAILVILLTLVAGRAWCGWLCPLGTVLDLIPIKSRKQPVADLPETWRKVKYLLLVAILLAALFGNLTLLVFDPLTIFVRSFTSSFWPAFDRAITASETVFYQVPFLQTPLSWIDSQVRPAYLPVDPSVYRFSLLYGGLFIGVIALNWFAPRFWCRYLCPLGGFLGWLSKIAIFRREVSTDACKDCPMCTRACPTGTIRSERKYASDPSECTVCLECLDSCRLRASKFTAHIHPSPWSHYDPSRREALGVLGVTAGAVTLAASEPSSKRPDPSLIQPPGARENNLLSKCIRCGECMRTCPTSGLQPAVTEAGLEGLMTPILLPRLGYCDYSCNACGQVCPVEAIPRLLLEEKRLTVIGKAYIDQNHCIAWSDHRDCIVCEEMCPLPEKAVYLIPTDLPTQDGNTVNVKLPYVQRELCIGCGICEYKCPVSGTAAIRVFSNQN